MTNTKKPAQQHQGGGLNLNLSDVYHVVFRHKWKIVILSCLGLVAAGIIYVSRPTAYTSEAQVLIKYVIDENTPQVQNAEPNMQVFTGPDTVIQSEMAILGSFDLGIKVATNIGPSKILAKYGGGDNIMTAAGVVRNNLTVERAGRGAAVIVLTLTHRDPDMVQSLLSDVIRRYKERHSEIHAHGEASIALNNQVRDIQNRLVDAEKKLQEAKTAAEVTDIDEAIKESESQFARLTLVKIEADAELEQYKALQAKLEGKSPATNATSTNVEAEIPQETIDRYTELTEFIHTLRTDYNQTRIAFSEHSQTVQDKLDRIKVQEDLKKKMEQEEPRLARLKLSSAKTPGQTATVPAPDPILAAAQVASQEAKIQSLTSSIAQNRTNKFILDKAVPTIHQLQRDRDILQKEYADAVSRQSKDSLDNDISDIKHVNIATIEEPTPAALERAKTPKMMGMAAASGIIAGLALAFLLELYIDRSVKRPKEIESDLGMRLFLSIPYVGNNGHRRLKLFGGKKESAQLPLPTNGESVGQGAAPAMNDEATLQVAPWEKKHLLHDYYEALRDRLISFFDINNLTHKPKLIAITGASKGSGASTIAAGLAASLSETGDGNVLLVDMHAEQGMAQQFYHGQPACELDDALGRETRNEAMIQDKLYLVSGGTNGHQLSRMLPKGFAALVPKLHASDYDYIIFDMPPIGRTGVTQRLAGFMDMTLLVVEAEKTSRDVVKQAGAAMAESKASVSVILNKTRSYIPAMLHQEF